MGSIDCVFVWYNLSTSLQHGGVRATKVLQIQVPPWWLGMALDNPQIGGYKVP